VGVSDSSQADADRKFGYWAGHLVVVGSMIGAGILTTSGYTLRDTGNPTALLGLWTLGGLLALCGAVTVAELATALPRSGGDYVFVREAYGRGAGFVSGWATFTLGFAAPTAVIAHLAVTYLAAPYTATLSAVLPEWAVGKVVPLGATLLIVVIGFVHTLGHRHSTRLQTVATVTTAVVLVTIAAGGILFGRGDWGHLSAGSWPTGRQWPELAKGLIYVGYAYAGWNAAAYLAGEIRDPARLLPRCLIGGAATVVVLYLLVNAAYVYALDPVEMTRRPEEEVKRVAELAADALFGRSAADLIAVGLGLALVSTVSAYLLTGPRVAFAMARDRAFPAFAGRLHPTRSTPALATFTQAAIAVGLAWSGSFRELLDYAAVGLAVLSGLTVASVFPLRHRAGLAHPYRLPLYPLPPLIYLALIGWTVGYTLYRELSVEKLLPGPALLSLLTLLIGLPLSRLLPDPPERGATQQ
jgi:APA family basic amino acid/polyamine antiporter